MDAISERCGSCGAPRDAVDQYCRVCGTQFDGEAPSGGPVSRAARGVVGFVGGIALLHVGLQLMSVRAGDPVQALVALVVGVLVLAFGGLAIAFAITLVIPRRGRPRRSRGA